MNSALLDTAVGCVSELAQINTEVAEFGADWATAAGELKQKARQYDRLHKAALRGDFEAGLKVAEKDAAAHAAVEALYPGLAERIEELEGEVERHKTAFKSLERRSSNAQSILSFHRDEQKLSGYVVAA